MKLVRLLKLCFNETYIKVFIGKYLYEHFHVEYGLLRHNIGTTNKNRETLIDPSKKVGLEMNVEKTKYTLLSRHQNVGQNRDIKIGDRSFENVSRFKYLGTTVTKSTFDSGGS
jgi:hypothetical protein